MQFFKSKDGLSVRSVKLHCGLSYIVQTYTYIGTYCSSIRTESVADICLQAYIEYYYYTQCSDEEFFEVKNKVDKEIKAFEVKRPTTPTTDFGYYLIQTAEILTA